MRSNDGRTTQSELKEGRRGREEGEKQTRVPRVAYRAVESGTQVCEGEIRFRVRERARETAHKTTEELIKGGRLMAEIGASLK